MYNNQVGSGPRARTDRPTCPVVEESDAVVDLGAQPGQRPDQRDDAT